MVDLPERKRPDNNEDNSRRKVFVGNLPYSTSWQDLKDLMKNVGQVEYADIFRDPQGKSKGCGFVEFSTEKEAAEAIKTMNESDYEGRTLFIREDRGERNSNSHEGSGFGSRRGGGKSYGSGRGGFRSNYEGGDRERGGDYYNKSSKGGAYGERGNYRKNSSDDRRRESYDSRDNSYGEKNRSRSRSKSRREGKVGGYVVVVRGLPLKTAWQDLKDLFRKFGSIQRADVNKNVDNSLGVVTFDQKSDAYKAIDALNDSMYGGKKIQVRAEF